MVSEDRAEQAIRYLAETDKEFARRETVFNSLERFKHEVRASQFQISEGNNAERDAQALTSSPYIDHLNQLEAAEREYLEMRYKRETEKLVWEHWRSVNANRRVGG